MTHLVQFLAVILPVGYVLSALLHGAAFAAATSSRVQSLRKWTFRLTLVTHFGLGAARWIQVGHFPVESPWTVISATILATACLYGVLARSSQHPGSGGVVLGLLFLCQIVASSFFEVNAAHEPATLNAVTLVHIGTVVLAGASVLLSGTHGLLYLVLYRQMRNRRFGPLFQHLPDLAVLARMTRHSAMWGFVLLTLGLNVGIAMAHIREVEGFDYRDPQVLITMFLWIHFGVVGFSKRIPGLSAKRAAMASIAGLGIMMVVLLLPLFSGLTFHS